MNKFPCFAHWSKFKMGIPYYFYVLMKTYPNILHVATPSDCSDFFVDFNGAIHHVANQMLNQEHDDYDMPIIEGTWDYLDKCVGIVKPSAMVHVCTDGVAPIAKIYQQRKRRYISVWKNKKSAAPLQWDRNKISPGTPFMATLQAHIAHSMRERATPFFYSTSDEDGEGEHKIFARIACLPESSRIIVHGLDADLIMLSLMSHHPNIFLMREPSGAYKDMETNDGFMYVDIDKLRCAVLKDLKVQYKWAITDAMIDDIYCDASCNMIEAYVVLCSILGNDFLPHPPTLPLKKGGYAQLLLAAKAAWARHDHLILPGCDINMRFLADVLTTLAASEDTDMWKINEEYLKRKPFENEEDPLDPYPLIQKDELCKVIYHNTPSKWRTFYYKHLFHTRLHDTTVIAASCKLFTQGILWVYRYYKRAPKDAEWYYPYNYAPSLRDLANYVTGLTSMEETELKQKFTTTKGFLHPHTQLLCIMPRESSPVLPKRVQTIIGDTNKGCQHMFPSDFHIQTYLKTHLWECTPVLPFLDTKLFENALKTI